MTDPVFSIATPTRNALEKLRRCVGSVRGQAGIALEHLVHDAASTDGTPEWLGNQAGLRGISQSDRGMYDAINRAWQRSGGQLLSWLNSDEQYLPGALARVQAFFEAHPEVDVLSGNYVVTDDQGRAVALRREIPLRKVYIVNSFLNLASCTLFFRRRLLDRGLLQLDSRFRYAADMDLILRLAEAGAVFRHIPDYLALFGIDGSNLSTHPQAGIEGETICRAHGAFRSRGARALVKMGRRLERLLRGGYRRESLVYRYALDERPTYRQFKAVRIGGRYSLADTQGSAEVIADGQ